MTALENKPRRGSLFAPVVVAAACMATPSSHATDLRGQVQTDSRITVTIELKSTKAPQAAIRKVVPDRDGRYYVPDIPPGPYELIVNGMKFSIAVEQVAIQELPPIRVKS